MRTPARGAPPDAYVIPAVRPQTGERSGGAPRKARHPLPSALAARLSRWGIFQGAGQRTATLQFKFWICFGGSQIIDNFIPLIHVYQKLSPTNKGAEELTVSISSLPPFILFFNRYDQVEVVPNVIDAMEIHRKRNRFKTPWKSETISMVIKCGICHANDRLREAHPPERVDRQE